MTDNDILAEYVRKKFPEIECSIDYLFYKMGVRFAETVKPVTEVIQKMADQLNTMDSDELSRETEIIEDDKNQ